MTHPASKAGCYAAVWLAFVYQYSEGEKIYFEILGIINEGLLKLDLISILNKSKLFVFIVRT